MTPIDWMHKNCSFSDDLLHKQIDIIVDGRESKGTIVGRSRKMIDAWQVSYIYNGESHIKVVSDHELRECLGGKMLYI